MFFSSSHENLNNLFFVGHMLLGGDDDDDDDDDQKMAAQRRNRPESWFIHKAIDKILHLCEQHLHSNFQKLEFARTFVHQQQLVDFDLGP